MASTQQALTSTQQALTSTHLMPRGQLDRHAMTGRH
jgi:hypothetical protein